MEKHQHDRSAERPPAACRVYLCTYRRPDTLKRAVDSLLAQTFTDWVCELHNDAPDDSYPRELVEEIGDPRITVVDHPRNLGPTRTFNLVFSEVRESFVTLLEDDNWWEPSFLSRMISEMERHPEVELAWSNMRMWQEKGGAWHDLQRTIWNVDQDAEPLLFSFPHPRQIAGALHSNGAMLVRPRAIARHQIPCCTTFAAVEPVRERSFASPLMLVPAVLANFAITESTAQSRHESDWWHIQVLLTASFLRHVPLTRAAIARLWSEARRASTRNTNSLALTGIVFPHCRHILRFATLVDIFFLGRSLLRHPAEAARLLRLFSGRRELWDYLDCHTAARIAEARAAGFTVFQ
ncbi:MAG TPA: glycosyltransferase family 2 protein [Acidobacteriaceae bacterium]|nr:glycosyltransferase family 2 protein [Acidobacteriaceae bacterium]